MEELPSPKSPQELQSEFLQRGAFYKKGFGILVQGLVCDLDLLDLGERNERVQSIRATINKMTSIYSEMLKEGLSNCPDADLLLPISSKIEELSLECEKIITLATPIDVALEILRFIHAKSMIFRARLQLIQDELRTHAGFEDARLAGTDIFGKKWDSVLGG